MTDDYRQPAQVARAALRFLPPEDIARAKAAGHLDDLLGISTPDDRDLVSRAARLDTLTRAELGELNRRGRHDLVAKYAAHRDRITD